MAVNTFRTTTKCLVGTLRWEYRYELCSFSTIFENTIQLKHNKCHSCQNKYSPNDSNTSRNVFFCFVFCLNTIEAYWMLCLKRKFATLIDIDKLHKKFFFFSKGISHCYSISGRGSRLHSILLAENLNVLSNSLF